MAVDFLRRARIKITNHALDFTEQTVIHGPKYCINRGKITGAKDIKTGKNLKIKISRFDRLVG